MPVDLVRNLVDLVSPDDGPFGQGAKPGITFTSHHVRQKAIAFIDAHLSSPTLRPSSVAEGVHVSRAVLYRAFQTDGGVASFLHERRLNKARCMLEKRADETGVVNKVSYACGYNNSARFSRLFISRFAEAPSHFVRRIRSVHQIDRSVDTSENSLYSAETTRRAALQCEFRADDADQGSINP